MYSIHVDVHCIPVRGSTVPNLGALQMLQSLRRAQFTLPHLREGGGESERKRERERERERERGEEEYVVVKL